MTKFVQPLRSGQITIPANFRKHLGITKDTILEISLERNEIRIKPTSLKQSVGNASWMKDLYATFSPIREEISKHGHSNKDIDTAIDEAVVAVRKKHAHRS